MITTRRRLDVLGSFDLARTAAFSFGPKDASEFDGSHRLAFVLDGYSSSAGVVVRVADPGSLELDISCAAAQEADAAAAQVARILSVDVDARGFDALARADEILAPLVLAAPGLRPPQFSSAYEALGWAVLSARRPRAQMVTLRDRLAEQSGEHFALDGGPGATAFPTPQALLQVTAVQGLPEVKLGRLHQVARAALDGRLDTEDLRHRPVAEAAAVARTLDGIGPFYADLMVVRALGRTDVLPTDEPRLLGRLGALLGRPGPVEPGELETLAERWRPWRTWACVHIRAVDPPVGAAAGTRVVPGSA